MTASRITPERRARRTAARTGGSIPSEWGPVIAQAADFEPEDDGALLEWMDGQVTGMSGYGEALVDLYDHCTNGSGSTRPPRPCSRRRGRRGARRRDDGRRQGEIHRPLRAPREFAGNGGLMTHDGRWVTGEGA